VAQVRNAIEGAPTVAASKETNRRLWWTGRQSEFLGHELNPMEESRNLDFLRSVAVLLVLVSHILLTAGLASRFPAAYDMGRLGVLIFFVHTSMVLMLSLERSEKRNGGHLFRDFYIRRAFRIYPLTIACVLLVSFFRVPQAVGAALTTRGLSQILANLLLVQNLAGQPNVIGPLWSLPLEVQMYAVLPFFFVFARRHSATALLALGGATVIVGLTFERLLSMHLVLGLGRLDTLDFIPCFVAGVMCYRLSKNRTAVLSSWLWPVAVVAIVTIYLLWQIVFPDSTDRNPAYRGWIVCWILGVLIPQFREVRLRWLRTASHYVAKYSYGIYLGQVPALWIGATFWPQMAGGSRWMVSVLLLVGIAVAGYHAIEHPGILLGKLVADRWESNRSPVAELGVGA
jgi:peptidoglycan/LPS O-acetylase OafA/YrhL